MIERMLEVLEKIHQFVRKADGSFDISDILIYSVITPMQLAPYTGFTEEEVKELCREYNESYEDISGWYDGYVVSTTIPVEMREKTGWENMQERK